MKEKQTRIYVPGAFDFLHLGHLNLLQKAREIAQVKVAGVVIAGVDTDEFITLVKGAPPVFCLEDRVRRLEACRFVDEVVINWGDADSKQAILKARADFILHGDDCSEDEYLNKLGVSKNWLLDHHIKLYLVPYTKGISSTEIKNRIIQRIYPSEF